MKRKCVKSIAALVAASIVCATLLTGCGDSANGTGGNEATEEAVANTVGTKYVAAFKASSSSDINAIADDLINGVEIDLELVKMDVEPGYLNGFTAEIQGFEQGVMFSPMIGSIPFVGYVFKTSDPATLEIALKDNADLRWNVCTEADEMVSAVNGDYVFFMMCTNE